MTSHAAGRHRAPGRFNPLSELSAIVARSAQPAVKTSGVLAVSGGLVAAFAVPAQATPGETSSAKPAVAAAPVAVMAPASPAPSATSSFGVIGFTATAKPRPRPRPVVVEPAPEPTPERVERQVQEPVRRHAHEPAREPVRQRSSEQASRSAARAPVTSSKPATGGVLAIAARYAGIMYYYGGTTPETGFDCSGFTQYVFRQVGISLPRTAEQQRQAVTPVSDPQPGDLVFFGSPAGHMGIYAGNGKMWDSPRTGKAVALRDVWSGNVSYGRP